jgi:hypothetical protein
MDMGHLAEAVSDVYLCCDDIRNLAIRANRCGLKSLEELAEAEQRLGTYRTQIDRVAYLFCYLINIFFVLCKEVTG